jgi:pyruvate dehydrogenase E1 component alpha subunit
MLLVENTYRTCGHSKSDRNLYRSEEEISSWKKKCPILAYRAVLSEDYDIAVAELDELERKTDGMIEAAVEYATSSPEPALDEALSLVYAEGGTACRK